eukprot:TCONS_00048294-protein
MCYRRVLRKQAFLFIFILFVALWFFIKSRNFVTVDNESNMYSNSIDDSKETDLELARLSKIEAEKEAVRNEQLAELEHQEMMRKREESLKQQTIEDDPFHPKHNIEREYTDFSNFKINFTQTNYKPADLREAVRKLNDEQLIYNKEMLKKLPKDYIVMVVQVHKRVEYFKELLDSMQRAKDIGSTLLVVSHDYYTDEMNALIRMIKFCPVVQIFFPFSLQLYPNEFPGPSPNDCPRDIKKPDARAKGCINAETPDMYGHYREAPIVMIKHHWWWKINHVMDNLDQTKKHNGPFLFIEEDHYLAPSFVHALRTLGNFKKSDARCAGSCEIMTLGTYNNKQNFQTEGKRVMRGQWISSQHNMGMAMYRNTWNDLKKCSEKFCAYDDYNWDWTLMHLSKHCLRKQLFVLLYEVPRIFHVGDCGLHHKKKCSSTKDTLNKIKGILERNKDYLYSDRIEPYDKHATLTLKPNGGWGDSRDHELCMRYTKGNEPLK